MQEQCKTRRIPVDKFAELDKACVRVLVLMPLSLDLQDFRKRRAEIPGNCQCLLFKAQLSPCELSSLRNLRSLWYRTRRIACAVNAMGLRAMLLQSLAWGLSAFAELSISSPSSVCSDSLGGGVSFLQASTRVWAPAPPAESSLDVVLTKTQQVHWENAINDSVIENVTLPENLTKAPIPQVQPIPDAEPVQANLSSLENLRDCVMGDWSEWSECRNNVKVTGLKGPHQIRQRSILQPWLPRGAPCAPQLEAQECLKAFR